MESHYQLENIFKIIQPIHLYPPLEVDQSQHHLNNLSKYDNTTHKNHPTTSLPR